MPTWRIVLAAGDAVAWIAWVVLGLGSHGIGGNLLGNVVRIAAPFAISWLLLAPVSGAYGWPLTHQRGKFLARSALAWLTSVSLGLILRATLFGGRFVPTFALVTFVVTGLLLLGWRAAFGWWVWRKGSASRERRDYPPLETPASPGGRRPTS